MFYVTHQIEVANLAGRTTKFQLEQDLPSAPSEIELLPLHRSGDIRHEFSTPEGEGILNTSVDMTFVANLVDGFEDIFDLAKPGDIWLRIIDGTDQLFLGYLDRDFIEEPAFIDTIFAFRATFFSGMARTRQLNFNSDEFRNITSGLTVDKAVFDVIVGDAILEKLCRHGIETIYMLDWESENYEPPAPGETFARWTFIPLAPWEDEEEEEEDKEVNRIKVWEVLRDICKAFFFKIGYSTVHQKGIVHHQIPGLVDGITPAGHLYNRQTGTTSPQAWQAQTLLESDIIRPAMKVKYDTISQVTYKRAGISAGSGGLDKTRTFINPIDGSFLSPSIERFFPIDMYFGVEVYNESAGLSLPADTWADLFTGVTKFDATTILAENVALYRFGTDLPGDNIDFRGIRAKVKKIIDPMLAISFNGGLHNVVRCNVNPIDITSDIETFQYKY